MTIRVELIATKQLEFPTQSPLTLPFGMHPQLAQLEMLINPTLETLLAYDSIANAGTLEIVPPEQAGTS